MILRETFDDSTSVTQAYVDLAPQGITARLDRQEVTPHLHGDAFEISFDVTADSAASWGEMFRLHRTLSVAVNGEGELVVQTFSDDGRNAPIKTSGAKLDDTGTHQVTIGFDRGALEISVDGTVMGSGQVSEHLGTRGAHDLTFGNKWGRKTFEGEIENFALKGAPDDVVALFDDPGAAAAALAGAALFADPALDSTDDIDRLSQSLSDSAETGGLL